MAGSIYVYYSFCWPSIPLLTPLTPGERERHRVFSQGGANPPHSSLTTLPTSINTWAHLSLLGREGGGRLWLPVSNSITLHTHSPSSHCTLCMRGGGRAHYLLPLLSPPGGGGRAGRSFPLEREGGFSERWINENGIFSIKHIWEQWLDSIAWQHLLQSSWQCMVVVGRNLLLQPTP